MEKMSNEEKFKKLQEEADRVIKGERVPHEVLSITLEGAHAILWRSMKAMLSPEELLKLEQLLGKGMMRELLGKLLKHVLS